MTQSTQKNPNAGGNQAVSELQALRFEFRKMREEVEGLRNDLSGRKPLNITDQVSKGVVIALMFCWVLTGMLSLFWGAVFAARGYR